MVDKKLIIIIPNGPREEKQESANHRGQRIGGAILGLNPRLLFAFRDGIEPWEIYPYLLAQISVGGDVCRSVSGGIVDQASALNDSLAWFLGMIRDFAKAELTQPTSIAVICAIETLVPLLVHATGISVEKAVDDLITNTDGYLVFDIDAEGSLSLAA
ncbi:MAG: hypothetical protein UW75_C0059G0010 [Parcubacteria group bacterium GW2011_GWF2_44_8]|nr:MAG: hypothetical protein UW75_C0059G0010 [Parcubacteria group bacterium GW2011_GWF2_44_8]